jgi:hypothetical protein
MKKVMLFVFSFCILFINISMAQQIENIRVKKLADKLNILYDLTKEKPGQLFDVKLLCSADGGNNFNVTINTVSGDIGPDIYGGKEKMIIWEVLKDQKNLKSENVVFKVIATPTKIINQTDYAQGFNFELIDCIKRDQTIICALKITNNGKKRDLKAINRLARIYDYKGTRVESHMSKLGRVAGNEKYAVPTLTFQPEQTEIAVFQFNIPPDFSNRLKLIEFGFEFLEITYGLDYKKGNIEFRDISLSNPETQSKAELVSEKIKIDLGPEIYKINDTKAPVITFTNPVLELGKQTISKIEDLPIYGKIKDDHGIYEFTINGMDVSVLDDGSFKTDVFLAEGNNTIFVRTTDIFQNNFEGTYQITFKPEKKTDQRQAALKNKSDANKEVEESSKEGKYYALLLGVNTYNDPELVNLEKPYQDAEKLYANLIKNYTFEPANVKLLKNPTHEEIIAEFDKLNKIIREKDNLLIFYAGHGYWDSEDEIGYWLPSDAKQANTANWIRNSTIRDYLKAVKTKHTLLIADACFSGGIFKSRVAFAEAPKSIQNRYEVPSRKAMTSGSIEEVPDKSVFMLYLNKRLEENTQELISAEELFSSLKAAVQNNGPTIPLYGEIKDTGDQGGDFVFVRRKK